MPTTYPVMREHLPVDLVPHVCALVRNLEMIGKVPKEFRAAVELHEFAEARMWAEINRGESDPHKIAIRWICFAATEGAMQLYHFRKALDGLSQTLRFLPELRTAMDMSSLRAARRNFGDDFPNTDELRHAVAHHAELGSTAADFQANAAIVHVDPTNGTAEYGLGLRVSNFAVTLALNQQEYSYDLTRTNLDKLERHRTEIRRVVGEPGLYVRFETS